MADYKLTRLPDRKGQIQYKIESVYGRNRILVSWDYEELEKIVERLEVGEGHIISI
jgi:hypothetical protein